MATTSWIPVAEDSDFPLQNLPYGVFSRSGELPRVGAAIGDFVLDLERLAVAGLLADRRWFGAGSLNPFMAAGRAIWQPTRTRLMELLTNDRHRPAVAPHLIPRAEVFMHMPFVVADYIDFFSSLEHAANVGRMLTPGAGNTEEEPLPANWRHQPLAYHGRAGTVVPSGTPIVRPCGIRRTGGDAVFGPTHMLDLEAEVGFVVGIPSGMAQPVGTQDFRDHVFGFVLVCDWSARDIQAWESRPLGPFLGKSFATSISPWVVPLEALEPARVPPPRQDPLPQTYLSVAEPWGLDLALSVELNGSVIAEPPFAGMYWTGPQQLAHATINGASLRCGDLMASGTVSGSEPGERGSLMELTWNGDDPLQLPDGTKRTFLEDGDTVRLRATAPGAEGVRIGFGAVAGTVYPAII